MDVNIWALVAAAVLTFTAAALLLPGFARHAGRVVTYGVTFYPVHYFIRGRYLWLTVWPIGVAGLLALAFMILAALTVTLQVTVIVIGVGMQWCGTGLLAVASWSVAKMQVVCAWGRNRAQALMNRAATAQWAHGVYREASAEVIDRMFTTDG